MYLVHILAAMAHLWGLKGYLLFSVAIATLTNCSLFVSIFEVFLITTIKIDPLGVHVPNIAIVKSTHDNKFNTNLNNLEQIYKNNTMRNTLSQFTLIFMTYFLLKYPKMSTYVDVSWYRRSTIVCGVTR